MATAYWHIGSAFVIYIAPYNKFFWLQGKKWDLSLASIWNTVVWLMLANFSAKVVNATAQGCLKEQQEKELAAFPTS